MRNSKNLKILQVSHAIYPDKYGGLPIGVLELSEKLSNSHKVLLLTTNYIFGKFIPVEKKRKLIILRWPSTNMFITSKLENPGFVYLNRLEKLIKKFAPDIIHAHSHLFFTTYQVANIARKYKIPFIVSIRGFFARRDIITNLLQFMYIILISRRVFNIADKIICFNNTDKNAFLKVFPEFAPKTIIIPNSVDLEQFDEINVKELPFKKENRVILLWTGRFVPEKRPILLLKIFKKLLIRYPHLVKDVRLVLAGSGPLKRRIVNIIHRDNVLKNTTVILFYKNYENMINLYKNADIFVFTSIREGMPKAVLEAMAAKLPVIAFKVPGVVDLADTGGILLINEGNIDEYIEMLYRLITDKKFREKLATSGYNSIVSKYSWKTLLDKYITTYLRVLENH